MKKLQITLMLIFILTFIACEKNENEYIFEDNRFEDLDKLTLQKVIETEKEIGSTERKYDNIFGIGEDYYPNKNKFELANPKVYERNQKELGLETNYFYTKKDSLIKVILYQWNSKYLNFRNTENDTLKNLNVSEKNKYQNKFNDLEKSLTEKLGKASKIDIEKRKDTSYNYRDEYIWNNKDLKVFLTLDVSGESFREIRLVVHKQ